MKHFIILFYAWLLQNFTKWLMISEYAICFRFLKGFNNLRHFNTSVKAYSEFIKAKKSVPAYKKFLDSMNFYNPTFNGFIPNLSEIPETDKENYIKIFSMNERCVNGKVSSKGIVIDESSGSSGTATNWVRGWKERKMNAKIIQFGIKNLMGNEPLFIINAFALGPWATGVNITMSCVGISKLKSIGPDRIKIENTINTFGRDHKYLIMGYPPFLKMLVDNSQIDWQSYDVSFIFGGESMSEGMRNYLITKGIKKIYSSFGASDIELNISAENDFTISLRKLLNSNESLRNRILKYSGALPMIFQYNPADFFIETSEKGELIITVCRPDYIAPKIRYNIHDKGQIMQKKQIFNILKELNINKNLLVEPKTDLPILFHYGRADMTVSFFGANISPTDIQETIYNFPELVKVINSFCIVTNEDVDGNKQLEILFELNPFANKIQFDLDTLTTAFFEQLAIINQDFREAKKMLISKNQTIINLFELGKGPFENSDIRIKAKYIC
jgi:phenylacetate-CoA ligase